MSPHPVSTALESLDEPASEDFRTMLQIKLLTQLAQDVTPEPPTATPFEPVELRLTSTRPYRESRSRVLLGIAAAVVVVAALAAVLINRTSDSTAVDTSRDPQIAGAALIPPDELGLHWVIQPAYRAFTSRVAAEVAATVPACAPYVDYAFDSPRRNAVTAERKFLNPIQTTMYQWVYVFPTEDQATAVMDKVAESAFEPCFTAFYEASVPVQDGNYEVAVTIADETPVRGHGDRQVTFATAQKFEGPGIDGSRTLTTMNIYIQVGRAIVYIDPIRDVKDDPKGTMETAMKAAVDALTTALNAPPPANG